MLSQCHSSTTEYEAASNSAVSEVNALTAKSAQGQGFQIFVSEQEEHHIRSSQMFGTILTYAACGDRIGFTKVELTDRSAMYRGTNLSIKPY
jgi:hypothetical protein